MAIQDNMIAVLQHLEESTVLLSDIMTRLTKLEDKSEKMISQLSTMSEKLIKSFDAVTISLECLAKVGERSVDLFEKRRENKALVVIIVMLMACLIAVIVLDRGGMAKLGDYELRRLEVNRPFYLDLDEYQQYNTKSTK
jgi:flagella basal body P-ring formation protein FlgA